MIKRVSSPPVLILGCGRSGTSIFGEMFQGLGSYSYSSEPPFAEMLATFGRSRAVKVPKESVGFTPDLGLSFPLQKLLESHPSTKIFWIVRHPLDAVCSLRIGIGNGWQHHPRPPDWREWLNRPLVEKCAHHWSCINRHGYDAVKDTAYLVRFEDMIHAPSDFAQSVCSEIGLSPLNHDRSLRDWKSRVQDTNNAQFIEALTSRNHSRPDHAVRVGRWRENLNPKEVQDVARIVAPISETFGYSLDDLV